MSGEYFRDAGHEVSSAADGLEAVAEITRHPTKYGLVVSDLQLPGMDGLGVLKAAKVAQDRQLTEKMEGRELPEAAPGIADRLDAMGRRLARIERALSQLADDRSRAEVSGLGG